MKRLGLLFLFLWYISCNVQANSISFGPLSHPHDTSSFPKGDEDTYNYLNIGTQNSMAKNLALTNDNDSTVKPSVSDKTVWEKFPEPGYCWYNNDRKRSVTTAGTLHKWYTVKCTN